MSDSDDALETRRLAIAFGLSWSTAAVIAATGGLAGGPMLLPRVPLSLVLLAGPYMFAPAVAAVAARLLTGEGYGRSLLRPRLRTRWRLYVLAWLGPVALVVLGAVTYFAVRPARFGGLEAAAAFNLSLVGGAFLSTEAFLALQGLQLLVLAPLVNTLFAFGEEFGWRGYLLPKLWPLGPRRALVAHGVVWGVWHWPIVAMGHNYGLDHPGAPWAGMAVMVLFTVAVGWLTLRSGSVWPASLAHAMVNGAAAVGLLFLVGEPELPLGPTASGFVAMLSWVALAAWLLADPSRLEPAGPLAGASAAGRSTDPAVEP